MKRNGIAFGLRGVLSALAIGLMLTGVETAHATGGAQGAQENKPSEQVFKNITVLEGMPSSQLLPVMHFMRTSLGVRCDYCHVAENGKYWMDDKPTKQVARQMIQMVFDINKDRFGGKTVVTCNTCHQGRTQPIAVPLIGQGAFENTTRGPESQRQAPLPTVDQVLDRYVEALGGKGAIERVSTRVTKVSLLRPRLVDGGTVNAHMIARGEAVQMEIYQKAPDKYLAITTTPDGVVYQGFNGSIGWVKSPSGQREMNSTEMARIRLQADFYKDIKLKERYTRMTVVGKEKLGDREAYVIEATNRDNKLERLLFDSQNGLLLRRTVFTQIALGLDPEQTDYEDYRDVDGLKLPFTVRVSYLDDSHLGTTRKLTEVRHNAPLGNEKFSMPDPAK